MELVTPEAPCCAWATRNRVEGERAWHRFIFKPSQKVLQFYSVLGVFNIHSKGTFIEYLRLALLGELAE